MSAKIELKDTEFNEKAPDESFEWNDTETALVDKSPRLGDHREDDNEHLGLRKKSEGNTPDFIDPDTITVQRKRAVSYEPGEHKNMLSVDERRLAEKGYLRKQSSKMLAMNSSYLMRNLGDTDEEEEDMVAELSSSSVAVRTSNDGGMPSASGSTGGSGGGDGSNSLSPRFRSIIKRRTVTQSFQQPSPNKPKEGYGTIMGVLVPTCENMWGVLIFLRFYYIVGQAGVIEAIAAVIFGYIISFLTTISLTAMITSKGKVLHGGPYLMISRSLGPYLGASIGLIYFLGVTLLAVLETLGAVIVFLTAVPGWKMPGDIQIYSVILMSAMAFVVFMGANFVKKISILFVTIVLLTLLSFYVGLFTAPDGTDNPLVTGLSGDTMYDNLGPDYDDDVDFSTILAIFYPCFAGILSGATRSDSLKNPRRSIPRGTFGAITLSLFMYLSFMLLWGGVAHREYLKGNVDYREDTAGRLLAGGGEDGGQIVEDITWPWPTITEIGIIIASISQALQSMIVAPRFLQSIAADKVVPFLDRLAPKFATDEPRKALGVTWIIGCLICLTGSIDIVAPMLTMCYLLMHAFMNFSCGILTFLMSTSWRPAGIHKKRYRLFYLLSSWSGFFVCIISMFFVQWYWALGVIILSAGFYIYIEYKGTASAWGSGLSGLRYKYAVSALNDLADEQKYAINWRPQLLCLYKVSENFEKGPHLEVLNLATYLKKGKGICIVAGIVKGDPKDIRKIKSVEEKEKHLVEQAMKYHKLKGFNQTIISSNISDGYSHVLQCSGLGGIRPNCVLLGWPSHMTPADFIHLVNISSALDRAVLIGKNIQQSPKPYAGYIDIWWIIHDGGVLFLMAYLINQHKQWRDCALRVFTLAEDGDDNMLLRNNITTFLDEIGITAEVHVVTIDTEVVDAYFADYSIRKKERTDLLSKLKALKKNKPIPDDVEGFEGGHLRRRSSDLVKNNTKMYSQEYSGRLNHTIQQHSAESPLVMVNLPDASTVNSTTSARDYLKYLTVLSTGLQSVIFVHGTGKEIIHMDHAWKK